MGYATRMSDDLQFDNAEYEAAPELPTTCGACAQPLGGAFWVEDRRMVVCTPCKEEREAAGNTFSPVSLLLGALGGLIGAFIGGVGWGLVTAITNYNIGLIAIVAGAIVAIGIRMGAGRGGLVYQLLAAVLTYTAICINELTIGVWQLMDEGYTALETILALVFVSPQIFVMLVPSTLEAGGFISILIYGFAVWQAIQMTDGGPPVFEGPIATHG